MSKSNALSESDRDFLRLLAEAAATNPFSDEYFNLQMKIAGCEDKTKKALATYGRLLRYAIMFDVFHRFLPLLDRLIDDQFAAGERSAPVSFADEVFRLLVRRGFSAEEGQRYFAIMYQIRRAFFFIDRGLVGCSESMKQLRRHLWNNVFTHDIRLYEKHLWNRMEDFSTMLLGETGTGKGAAAAAIGRSGYIPFDEKKGAFTESFTRSFTALNLSQFPESLIESELFGHRKGAFTGAMEAHEGILARCSAYGAIFLDEIGDASMCCMNAHSLLSALIPR